MAIECFSLFSIHQTYLDEMRKFQAMIILILLALLSLFESSQSLRRTTNYAPLEILQSETKNQRNMGTIIT